MENEEGIEKDEETTRKDDAEKKEETQGDTEEEKDALDTKNIETVPIGEETTEEVNDYQTLETVYRDIHAQLENMEGMENFDREYTRLFEEYYKISSYAEQLREDNEILIEQVNVYASKLDEAIEITNADKEKIVKYKSEIEYTGKMIDAVHAREMNSQEVLENQRKEISRLNTELEHMSRLVYAGEDALNAKKEREQFIKETERLNREIAMMRERVDNVNVIQETLEKENLNLKRALDEVTEAYQANYIKMSTKDEKIARLNNVINFNKIKLEEKESKVENMTMQLKEAQETIDQMKNKIDSLQEQNESFKNEVSVLSKDLSYTQADLELKTKAVEMLTFENNSKTQDLVVKNEELSKLRTEFSKEERKREQCAKKLLTTEMQKSSAQQEKEKMKLTVSQLQQDLGTAKKQADEDKSVIEELQKEKTILSKNLLRAAASVYEQSRLIKLQDQIKKNLQIDIDNFTIESKKQQKDISYLERERDRYVLESQELTQKINDILDEMKVRQIAIDDYKKKLAEADTRFRMQQNLYETVRGERNSLNKLLLEAQDQISELKHKLKVVSHQIEQLKEDITTKEIQLMKKESALEKSEKEKEHLKVELKKVRDELEASKQQIMALTIEARKLEKIIQDGEKESKKQKQVIEQLTNEQNILGTQLVNKKDELKHLYEKERLLQGSLHKGEAQYDQRLEDIRLLKLEVKKLRQEKNLLIKNTNSMTDIRQQNFHLERDLTREKLKCRALEEELQSPVNIHRWRKLEGTDPNMFELLQKIQHLEKRVLVESQKVINTETKLQETENLYKNLRDLLSRQPGPEAAVRLQKTQKALKERDTKIKCLIVELNMNEAQILKYKSDLERINEELKDMKQKYYELKLNKDKIMIYGQELSNNFTLPPISNDNTPHFLGGGYNMTRKF